MPTKRGRVREESPEYRVARCISDSAPGSVKKLLDLNRYYREARWPQPFDKTKHVLRVGDSRDLSWLANKSVHLVVTSPPYWTLKKYETSTAQLGDIDNYEMFLDELDKTWKECARVLVPGGRICCIVGDVCLPRKREGRHHVMPLHSDITVRMRRIGLDSLTPILWFKIANGKNESEGNGAGFYGKPYQPGAIVKNDVEYILFFRKPGEYRSPSPMQKALSMLTKEEMQNWLRSAWHDLPGESTRKGHPAPYPIALPERLIRMFSFAGDVVLDPFSGTGSTSLAAMKNGRNSIGCEIETKYHSIARSRLVEASCELGLTGATRSEIVLSESPAIRNGL